MRLQRFLIWLAVPAIAAFAAGCAEAAPSFASPPPDTILVRPGRAIPLTAAVEGEGEISSQWYRGSPGDTSDPIAGATSPTTLIPPVLAPTQVWLRVTDDESVLDSAAVSLVEDTRTFDLWQTPGNEPVGSPRFIAHGAVQAGLVSWDFVGADHLLWGVDMRGPGADGQLYGVASVARTDVWQIASGDTYGLYIAPDRTLWAVGDNSYGSLGSGLPGYVADWTAIAADVTAVSTRIGTTVVLHSDGTLRGMGLLFPPTEGSESDGTVVATGVAQCAAGGFHTLYVRADGTLWGLGNNFWGPLGPAVSDTTATPVQLASDVVMAAATSDRSFFLKRDGTLWAMGGFAVGQFGQLMVEGERDPRLVATDVVHVSAADGLTLFLKADGSVWRATHDHFDELENGDLVPRYEPEVVPLSGVADVVAGGWFSAFLREAAPAIAAGPAGTAVTPGATTTLQVDALGTEPLAFQWFAGAAGDDSAPIAGAMAPVFTPPPLTDGATGASCWVRISNAAGSVDSAAAVIEPMAPPAIVHQPQRGYATEDRLSPSKSRPRAGRWSFSGSSASRVIRASPSSARPGRNSSCPHSPQPPTYGRG